MGTRPFLCGAGWGQGHTSRERMGRLPFTERPGPGEAGGFGFPSSLLHQAGRRSLQQRRTRRSRVRTGLRPPCKATATSQGPHASGDAPGKLEGSLPQDAGWGPFFSLWHLFFAPLSAEGGVSVCRASRVTPCCWVSDARAGREERPGRAGAEPTEGVCISAVRARCVLRANAL